MVGAATNVGEAVEIRFFTWLDEIAAKLETLTPGSPELPDDELHRDIFQPLLPCMLRDRVIRAHWTSQKTTGLFAQVSENCGALQAPAWSTQDLEIHVAASYAAGADAKALADTLLSEAPLRELAVDLMNRIGASVWTRGMQTAIDGPGGDGDVASGILDTASSEATAPHRPEVLAPQSGPEPPGPETPSLVRSLIGSSSCRFGFGLGANVSPFRPAFGRWAVPPSK